MQSLKIAILGSGGFLGRKLSTNLANFGHEVSGFVLNPQLNRALIFPEYSIYDLLGSSESNKSKFDVAINLAARRSTKASQYSQAEVEEYTFQIPYDFFIKTLNPNTLAINASTYIQNYKGISANTIDSYSHAKQKLSQSLELLAIKKNLRILDLFFFTLYGPNDRSTHLIPALLEAGKYAAEIELSPGHQLINLLYVEDAVENISRCLNFQEVEGYSKFHLWTDQLLSIREVVSKIENELKIQIACKWGSRDYTGHEMLEPWAQTTSLLPGFTAHTSFEQGILNTWKYI